MLVLTRKEGERIVVGKDIVITLVKVKGSNIAKIGIEAPKELVIVREELLHSGEKDV